MQIEYDIEKAVQNGTISISEPKNTFEKTLTGMSYRAGENVIADVTYNNCISDAVILSHELAHVRNNTKKYVYTRKFLTETTSYAEQLVFTDYLKKLGYENDSNIFNTQALWNLWRFNFRVYEIIAAGAYENRSARFICRVSQHSRIKRFCLTKKLRSRYQMTPRRSMIL